MRLIGRVFVWIGMAIGHVICWPQLQLGRRRHDGRCDECGEPIGRYAMEKLEFPGVELQAVQRSTFEHMRDMYNAEYVRICIYCDEEDDDAE